MELDDAMQLHALGVELSGRPHARRVAREPGPIGPARSRRAPWWWMGVGAVALAGALAFLWFVVPRSRHVPIEERVAAALREDAQVRLIWVLYQTIDRVDGDETSDQARPATGSDHQHPARFSLLHGKPASRRSSIP